MWGVLPNKLSCIFQERLNRPQRGRNHYLNEITIVFIRNHFRKVVQSFGGGIDRRRARKQGRKMFQVNRHETSQFKQTPSPVNGSALVRKALFPKHEKSKLRKSCVSEAFVHHIISYHTSHYCLHFPREPSLSRSLPSALSSRSTSHTSQLTHTAIFARPFHQVRKC